MSSCDFPSGVISSMAGKIIDTRGVLTITRGDYERVPEFKVRKVCKVKYSVSGNAGCREYVLKSNQLPKWYLKGPNIWHWFESEEGLLSVLHKTGFAH